MKNDEVILIFVEQPPPEIVPFSITLIVRVLLRNSLAAPNRLSQGQSLKKLENKAKNLHSGVFEVADSESEVGFLKNKMVDPKWRPFFQN